MTRDLRAPHDSQDIDQLARALHAKAVEQVPAHTLARLRPRPEPTSTRSRWLAGRPGWGLATACAAVFMSVAGLYLLVSPDGPGLQPLPIETAAEPALPVPRDGFDPYDDPLSTFEEDPDLFVWLASEAQPVAME